MLVEFKEAVDGDLGVAKGDLSVTGLDGAGSDGAG